MTNIFSLKDGRLVYYLVFEAKLVILVKETIIKS